jgi:hypothetical protein
MSNAQAFVFGMMAAWTPSLVVLAVLLQRAVLEMPYQAPLEHRPRD